MSRTVIALVAAAALALGACGKKEMLKAADNTPLPPRPATSPAQPQPGDLLATESQMRPQRFNEIVTKSRELRSDRFDMPPPG